jgi:hypothetical protein
VTLFVYWTDRLGAEKHSLRQAKRLGHIDLEIPLEAHLCLIAAGSFDRRGLISSP